MSIETIAGEIGQHYYILFYLLVAVFSFFESIPFFGGLIPGQVLIMVGGFLARLNGLNVIAIISIAAVFAFLGELYAFNIGKKHGFSLVKKYGKYVFINSENFKSIKDLMHNHTAKAIVFGRLNSLTRALSPFTAGASGLSIKKFAKYSIIGSFLWAIAFTLIGYIFAEGYKTVAKSISAYVAIATFIAIAIIIGYRFMNKRKHVFTKRDFYKLVAGILSLYLVAKLAEDIITRDAPTLRLDSFIHSFINGIYNPLIAKLFVILSIITEPSVLVILGFILSFILYRNGNKKRSLIVIISLLFGAFSEVILKALIHQPRPIDALIQESSYSFPSGHATLSCIFFLLIIYTLKHNWSRATRATLTSLSIFLILLIGFSRIYLNMHWLSDVIAGYALGIFWVSLSILAIKYIDYEYNEKGKNPRKLKILSSFSGKK